MPDEERPQEEEKVVVWKMPGGAILRIEEKYGNIVVSIIPPSPKT